MLISAFSILEKNALCGYFCGAGIVWRWLMGYWVPFLMKEPHARKMGITHAQKEFFLGLGRSARYATIRYRHRPISLRGYSSLKIKGVEK